MFIANNNNCWFTNVGEAFIDLGVKSFVNKIIKHNEFSNIHFGAISNMSQYYLSQLCKTEFDESLIKDFTNSVLYPDVYILPGMYASVDFLESGGTYRFAKNVVANGGKIVFLGLGGARYDRTEYEHTIKIFRELDPLCVITRDKKTYDIYKDWCECKRGIDCAFWITEDFNPIDIRHKYYEVSTFNRSDEPQELSNKIGLIHPWHFQYDLSSCKTRYLSKENLFISDDPYSYITLYANAGKCYTDMVHATIICLEYSTPVKYWRFDDRRDAFESLECLNIDSDGFMTLDIKDLEDIKKNIELYFIKKLKDC